jgi:hypothetical protein
MNPRFPRRRQQESWRLVTDLHLRNGKDHARRGVIAMGGNNAFREILSFDKPALLSPANPALEQYAGAERAAELGFATMFVDAGSRGP